MDDSNKIGLSSFRKNKTKRPATISPENSASNERTMPETNILDHSSTRKKQADLPKSIRISVDTHTALSTIALMQDKPIYQTITDIVEAYIQDLPSSVRKQIKSNVQAKKQAH